MHTISLHMWCAEDSLVMQMLTCKTIIGTIVFLFLLFVIGVGGVEGESVGLVWDIDRLAL